MKRMAAAVVAAVLLPLGLAAGAYWISSRSFEPEVSSVPISTEKIAKPPSRSEEDGRSNGLSRRSRRRIEDVSGNCDEAEHANDPECPGGSTRGGEDDGSGSGGNSGPGSGSSGSGSSGSGSSGSGGSGRDPKDD
jgi:hypothetical protein